MVTKVRDLTDCVGGNIGEHGLKREPISTHIRNGSKSH
jgi:hypothetical protein